ncbi:MAG TPA: hypothetical protein VNZ86_14805, partial [Bacteroidia bacterium]|nr:hypothetical protein [Bacteroidia bacterium]
MQDILSYWDLIMTPLAIVFVLVASSLTHRNDIKHNPLYKYYMWGLAARIVGALALCLVYVFYYGGGDTINYYLTSKSLLGLLGKETSVFFDILMGDTRIENFSYFDQSTGFPIFWFDQNAFSVVRFITPICLLAGKSYLATSILLGWVCYSGMWRMYLLFAEQFPKIKGELAFAVLFAPSVVFWGSGILKDTITISCVGWYSYGVYRYFIQKNYRNMRYLMAILVAGYLLVAIKPYILFALLPGSVIWLSYARLTSIRNKVFMIVALPVMGFLAVFGGFFLLTQLDQYLGVYSINKVIDQAVVVQTDMKQEYYQGNTFDIGKIDPTIGGILSKAHLAIAATLFRPYLWDVRNVVMLISAFENTYILGLTLFLLFRLKFFGFFALIGKHPLLLFSILFSLFFAFSVGISISNFGALVRLKIPCIPYYLSSLFI